MDKHQQNEVLRHLKSIGTITSQLAWRDYGITRLADVVYKLRKRGYDIETETIKVKNRHGRPVRCARYSLASY